MNRILDFTPSQEEALVARVLVLVHQTIDDSLPAAEKATRQFTKTVFSDDNEKTAIGRPGDADQFADAGGDTAKHFPEGDAARGTPPPPPAAPAAKAGGHAVPPPPAQQPPQPPPPAAERGSPSYVSQLNPIATTDKSALATGMTGHSGIASSRDPLAGPDWVTRITLALLIAGLVLLAYALFS
jgi:hypothetical protein